MEKLIQSAWLRKFIARVDQELADAMKAAGCIWCLLGVLHHSDYERKLRGCGEMNETDLRVSFCCNREGCRKRHTPPSLMFLGRRRYSGVVVVLLTAMTQGVNEHRVRQLREELGVDARTLKRWRKWWMEDFVQSAFWKGAKAFFRGGVDEGAMPLPLVKAFGATRVKGLIKLMTFLLPISIGPLGVAGAK